MEFFTKIFEHVVAIAAFSIIIFLINLVIQNVLQRGRVFISIPMATVPNEDDRKAIKKSVNVLSNELQARHHLKVYCAYLNVDGNFDSSRKAYNECFKELRKCRYFVAFLTERLPTSTYIEIGYALGKKKSVLIYHAPKALPYLIKEIETSGVPLTGGRVLARRTEVESLDAAMERLGSGGVSEFPGLLQQVRTVSASH